MKAQNTDQVHLVLYNKIMSVKHIEIQIMKGMANTRTLNSIATHVYNNKET